MATNRVTIAARPDDVFAVLLDARSYADWLVGCKHIRAVDDGWPAPGTSFHHRVGMGPLAVEDHTEVVSVDRPRSLVLRARARPLGTAEVAFEVAEAGEGAEVVIHEKPVRGLAQRLDNPVLDATVSARNAKSLRNLKAYVEARQRAR